MPDKDRAQDRMGERKSERADTVEHILDETVLGLEGRKFPVTTEELATEYADQPLDMVNETESLGSVFDRMTERKEFESPQEVREALYNELSGQAGGDSMGEYNEERDVQELSEVEGDYADDVEKP
ncbi:hypothetical protein ACFO0N_11215 [Halobium salinum]|uniref:DUF2795 domain-containing protein n=1 Tax=Halobium salinum TaxID=1364940 RepID=A0ABD5PC93_9EURY|nr:hypothetical protein [Halobium salinum]